MLYYISATQGIQWMFSSAGRATPLQGVGRRFEPVNIHHFFREAHGGVAKRLNAVDCNSIPIGFGSSNLPPSTIF